MQKGLVLNAGGFGAVPAGMRHYGWTDGGTARRLWTKTCKCSSV
jgi:hypothetical protein